MHHGQNRGKEKASFKLSKKLKLNENRGNLSILRKEGGIYKFCENRGKFINFVKIGAICNMHCWLGGRTPSNHGWMERSYLTGEQPDCEVDKETSFVGERF